MWSDKAYPQKRLAKRMFLYLYYNLLGSLSCKVSHGQTTFFIIRQYYDNLYDHHIYCETVHHYHHLPPTNVKLNRQGPLDIKQNWSYHGFAIKVFLPLFITNKFAKLFNWQSFYCAVIALVHCTTSYKHHGEYCIHLATIWYHSYQLF